VKWVLVFYAGMMVGTVAGILVAGLCAAAAKGDDE